MRTSTRQIPIHKAARFLEQNGFMEIKGRMTSHRQFVHETSHQKITIPGHGREVNCYLWSYIIKKYDLIGW